MNEKRDPLVILLAAGQGKRLRPLTDHIPKALIKVDEQTTLLERLINQFSEYGIKQFLIVGGHEYKTLTKFIARTYRWDDDRHIVSCIYNPDYKTKNNAFSVLCGLWRVVHNRDMYIVNTDIYCQTNPVSLLTIRDTTTLLVDPYKQLTEESMKVQTNTDQRLLTISKATRISEAKGEYVGIAKVVQADLSLFESALHAIIQIDPVKFFYEDAFQILRGWTPVGITWTGLQFKWTEIDTLDDYAYAQTLL